jgi:hypothetical protein
MMLVVVHEMDFASKNAISFLMKMVKLCSEFCSELARGTRTMPDSKRGNGIARCAACTSFGSLTIFAAIRRASSR